MAQVTKHPVLDQAQEYKLGLRARAGDQSARDKLVLANQRYVIGMACSYAEKHADVELEDLIAEGNIGLIRASQLYDPTKGVRFVTYAKNWILQAVSRYIYESCGAIRFPQHQAEYMRKIAGAVESGCRSTEEIAQATQISLKDVELLMHYLTPVLSLDAPVEVEGVEASFGDLVSQDDDGFDKGIEKIALRQILDRIPQRHREVLERNYGVFGLKEESVGQLAERFGISTERIRQIRNKALQECRVIA